VYDIEELSLNDSSLRKDVCFDSKRKKDVYCLSKTRHAALFVFAV